MDRKSVKPLEELLDSVRDIDGFPIAEDKDILALSDPPFYTACPNPYIKEFIEEYGTPYDAENDDYHMAPFLGDISGKKTDPIYMAHTYHTKVPHKSIMQFIEHYTEPNNIVCDVFCGTGMTGVAAQATNRKAILLDLSPVAGFISDNYNKKIDLNSYKSKADKILISSEKELGWMYKTQHNSKLISGEKIFGTINYVIWSDIYQCPYSNCKGEFNHWDVAVNTEKYKLESEFKCPNCGAEISKNDCTPVTEKIYDKILKTEIEVVKQEPSLIDYNVGKNRYQKKPDQYDLNLIDEISNFEIPHWFPIDELPYGYNTKQPMKSHNYKYVHYFFTKRNLWIISNLWEKMDDNALKFIITSFLVKTGSKLHNIGMKNGKINLAGQVPGTLFVPSFVAERNIFKLAKKKLNDVIKGLDNGNDTQYIISTQSSTDLSNFPQNCIDYIFIDPPFGKNLMYSELSYIWESWLKVKTNNKDEAIINETQQKLLKEYTDLITESFTQMYRILKPNHWVTVEFHNSQASVWNGIQEAMNRAGFIIAQVAVFDKGQGTFKQQTSPGSVKNDLIINAYKPEEAFSHRFIINAGEGMEIDFVNQQLSHLPSRPNIERTEKMLFSKMLAHYVENGFKIRYNSNNFYKLLLDNYNELDGYWFLENQVKEYNKWKSGLSLDKLQKFLDGQQVLLVSDEKSALTWIYHFLNNPKDYSEIFTAYQQVATKSSDYIPELRELLDNNFIIESGKYRRPLSEKELEDINKNRGKELDRAFNKLLEQAKTKKGKIKEIRREALVHGFTKCYQEGKYQDILTIADKLYASTLESSGDIMDFVDIARIKTSGQQEL